jgi:hypothetical protein
MLGFFIYIQPPSLVNKLLKKYRFELCTLFSDRLAYGCFSERPRVEFALLLKHLFSCKFSSLTLQIMCPGNIVSTP